MFASFADLVRGDPDAVELDLCAASISWSLTGCEPMDVLVELDELAATCPSPTPEGVARHLFLDCAFEGNVAGYYDWRNSCLSEVLRTRRGLPITLSILLIEVGRRVGVELRGVGMPMHFLVGVRGQERYFDPFHGHEPMDVSDVEALFGRITSGRVRFDPGYLACTPNRHIVARVLGNLDRVCGRRGDHLRRAIVAQLRGAIPEIVAAEGAALDLAVAPLN